MRRIIKASMEDRSSMERFQFSLRCAVCGFLWESQPVRFSKAGMQPESEGKRVIFQALYRREREEAFEWAVTEALEHFSLCPICKRLVCDRCFLLGEDIDLCTDCAENEGSFCTGCGLAKPLTCEACGWQPKPGASAPAYCPECGNRLK